LPSSKEGERVDFLGGPVSLLKEGRAQQKKREAGMKKKKGALAGKKNDGPKRRRSAINAGRGCSRKGV